MVEISNYQKNTVDIYASYRKPIGIETILKTIQSIDKKPEDIKILDCGCGSGNYTKCLSKYNYQITAIDNSEHMLNNLNQWIEAHDKQIITKQINLKTNSILEDLQDQYDVIIINQVIHHLNDYEENFKYLRQLIHNISSLLIPNGIFLLNTSDVNQHVYGMWWGVLFEKEIRDYCKRYCPFDTIVEFAKEAQLTNTHQHICKEPFIGEEYFNPSFIFDPAIRKTDTLWMYISDNTYETQIKHIKKEGVDAVYEKYNKLDTYGQSCFLSFKKGV